MSWNETDFAFLNEMVSLGENKGTGFRYEIGTHSNGSKMFKIYLSKQWKGSIIKSTTFSSGWQFSSSSGSPRKIS